MRFRQWLCMAALLLAAGAAGAVSIVPGDYLNLLARARVYGYVPVTVNLYLAAGYEENVARRDALLAELGSGALPTGQVSSIRAGFLNYFSTLYVNESGLQTLARSAYVKTFESIRDDGNGRLVGAEQLTDTLACTGSVDVEMTIGLENLSFALDATGNTVYLTEPGLDDELRREVPGFLATLPAAHGTWLNPPTLGADGLLHYEPTLKFRVNQTGLVALMHHDRTSWLAPVDRTREEVYVDPYLLPEVELHGFVRSIISLRFPDGYGTRAPSLSREKMYAALNESAQEIVAALELSADAYMEIAWGTIYVTLAREQLLKLLAAPDPRIGSISWDIPLTPAVAEQSSIMARHAQPRRPQTTSASCPAVEYPAPGTRLCLRETELSGDSTATTLLHYLHLLPQYSYSVGSLFVGATDSAQPGRMWLMDGLGTWHEYVPGEPPAVYTNRLYELTGINILSVPTDLRGLEGRVSFWVGYGRSITRVPTLEPADHLAQMLNFRNFRKVWTVGGDDASQGEVCAELP